MKFIMKEHGGESIAELELINPETEIDCILQFIDFSGRSKDFRYDDEQNGYYCTPEDYYWLLNETNEEA